MSELGKIQTTEAWILEHESHGESFAKMGRMPKHPDPSMLMLTCECGARRFFKATEEHVWWIYRDVECCRVCGACKRADGKNPPCQGPVRIELRKPDRTAEEG